jgi:hypothetical protein
MRLNWVLFLSMLALSGVASAGDFLSGRIEIVRPDNYDVGGVFITVSGTMSGAQTCTFPDGGSNNWYFITKNNPLMRELLSVALSAKLSGKTVNVVGKGVCAAGFEDVRFIQIN